MFLAKLFKNGLLLAVSLLVSLLIAEAVCRVFFDPIDLLMPELERDEWLQLRIPANSGGHDEWGFRNSGVPKAAKIVAIGDSNTYGIAANHKNSWPRQLAKQTGDEVYNMSLGSYGPLQYLRLLETKALDLNPEVILIGLYFGNDFYDAFRLANFVENWSAYSGTEVRERKAKQTLMDDELAGKKFAFARYWLARNSVLYRLLTTKLKPMLSKSAAAAHGPHKLTTYQPAGSATPMTFQAERWVTSYKTERADLDEGLAITLQVIENIKAFCDENQLKLVFLTIPTKELVYSDLVIAENPQLDKDQFTYIAAAENNYRQQIFASLNEHKIEYVDLLPSLVAGVESNPVPIYPSYDSHPNAAGYKIIADKVAQKLQALQY